MEPTQRIQQLEQQLEIQSKELKQIKMERETLKLQLEDAISQLNNTHKDQSLHILYESPRITIQMLSEFIERMPNKHKEKIWSKHSTKQSIFIVKDKILHILYTYLRLLIRSKDKTYTPPLIEDTERILAPLVDIIKQNTENVNGMNIDEFKNEIHFWILEAVNINIVSEKELWLDEINELRQECVVAQKEKLRIQRNSQMDLSILLDKLREFEEEKKTMIDMEKLENDMIFSNIKILFGDNINAIHDLIPFRLDNKALSKYKALFDGYYKNVCNKASINNGLPDGVNKLISLYYPVFDKTVICVFEKMQRLN
eukprot:142140_1